MKKLQLENSGDLPAFNNVHELGFGECLYFLMVTMSTVGYGDIVCDTKVGRVFQLLFLGVGLVSVQKSQKITQKTNPLINPWIFASF